MRITVFLGPGTNTSDMNKKPYCTCKCVKEQVHVTKKYKKSVLEFEKLHDNIVRSIATYYASGVMGKGKYKSINGHFSNCSWWRWMPIRQKWKRMFLVSFLNVGRRVASSYNSFLHCNVWCQLLWKLSCDKEICEVIITSCNLQS